MRRAVASTAIIIVAALVATGRAQHGRDRAAAVLQAAQAAIRVTSQAPAIAGLRLTGTLVETQGITASLRDHEKRLFTSQCPTEIRLAFPQRFVRAQAGCQTPSGTEQVEHRQGIDNDRQIVAMLPLTPDQRVPPPEMLARRLPDEVLDRWRRDLALLALGALARTDTLRRPAITAETDNRLQIDGALSRSGRLSATLELDATSRIPVRVAYHDQLVLHPPGTLLRPAGPLPDIPALPEEPKDVVVTVEFSDRRDVGGYRLPFRITTTGDGILMSEFRVDVIVVNPESM